MSYVRGYLVEIRVLPMTAMLLTCLLGGLFARGPNIDWTIMGFVLLNAFCFLYVAHLNDTLFDVYFKGEYEEGRRLHRERLSDSSYLPRWGFGYEIPNAPILPKSHYLAAMAFFSALGVAVMIYLSTIVGWLYSVLAMVGLATALTYSAGIDKKPVLGDFYWQTGVLFALFCGYYSQSMKLDELALMLSIPLFIALTTVKMLDSLPDTIVDDKNDKRTLTVLLYRRGLSLGSIRHVSFAPAYVAFSLLLFGAPPKLAPGVVATIIAIALIHAMLHKRDKEHRWSVVLVTATIIAFICYSVANILS